MAGSGRPKVQTVLVPGVVTLDGRPPPHILVNFHPVADQSHGVGQRPGSSGITDSNGRFTLKTPEEPGAVPGKHVVALAYEDPNELVPQAERPQGTAGQEALYVALPSQAGDGSIRFTVPGDGTENADFSFESR